MRKFFTFVILALVAISVWGTEVTIGSGSEPSAKYPLYPQYKYGLTQFIYLSSEIGTVTETSISKIAFNACASGTYTRNISIYIEHTNNTDLSSGWIAVTNSPVFSGNVDVPDGGWYDIPLSTNFTWNQKSNILVTICDNTNAAVGEWSNYKKHYVYSATDRGRASGNNNSSKDPANPSGGITVDALIPQIKFYFEASTPVVTPSIAVSGTKDVGVIEPAFETKDVVLTITGENLDENVSVSCAEGLSCTDTQIDKEDAMAEGGAQVTISTTNDFNVEGTKVTFTSGTATKEVTITGTAASYYSPTISATFFNYSSAIASPYFGYVYYNASNLTISDVADSQFKPYGTASFKVDYSSVGTTCESGGKVANLKGKFISEEVFKAFSFDYEAPEQTGIVIDEDNDNSEDWPEDAQSKDLVIKRTIVPNEWNSIVLPTYLTSTEVSDYFGAGTDVEAFSGAVVTSSRVTLNFTPKTDGIEASVPYLIKPTQALPNPLNLTNHSFKKTINPDTYDGIEFVGVLVPTEIDGGDGSDYIIVGANNTLLHPTGTGSIKGMRAYFHVIGTEAKAAIRKSPMISLSTGSTGSTTAMTLVKPDAGKAYKAIENGRIVIKTNGKKVNVLGQTVK